ncbi:MAG: stage III sporulation protein AF [Clostridia bacterium]|nr:stage III sporulation protein AF [Clostridia bacterium]
MRDWIAYLGEILLITAVSGLLYTIAPEGNLKKHLHFVISLCVLVSLAVPMFSAVMQLPEIFEKSYEEAEKGGTETNEKLTDSLISVSKKEIEKAIVSYLSGKYGVAQTDISVETVLDAENPESVEILEIRIIFKEKPAISLEKIREDIHEMFLGKSSVTVSVQSE